MLLGHRRCLEIRGGHDLDNGKCICVDAYYVDACIDISLRGSIRTARAPRMHRACTARAPRQVFEQLLQEMVYGERSCRWYLLGSEALPFPLIGSG